MGRRPSQCFRGNVFDPCPSPQTPPPCVDSDRGVKWRGSRIGPIGRSETPRKMQMRTRSRFGPENGRGLMPRCPCTGRLERVRKIGLLSWRLNLVLRPLPAVTAVPGLTGIKRRQKPGPPLSPIGLPAENLPPLTRPAAIFVTPRTVFFVFFCRSGRPA